MPVASIVMRENPDFQYRPLCIMCSMRQDWVTETETPRNIQPALLARRKKVRRGGWR